MEKFFYKNMRLCLIGLTTLVNAQSEHQNRVGINTETPRASLEVKALPANGKAQGILFPHIKETDKNAFAVNTDRGLVAGTVIWNTTKKCLDFFDGTQWSCTDGTKKNLHGTNWENYEGSYTLVATKKFTKNNCPTDRENGEEVSFTESVTRTATSKVSQADADEKARQLAEAEYNRRGQEYANANGKCFVYYFKKDYKGDTDSRQFWHKDREICRRAYQEYKNSIDSQPSQNPPSTNTGGRPIRREPMPTYVWGCKTTETSSIEPNAVYIE